MESRLCVLKVGVWEVGDDLLFIDEDDMWWIMMGLGRMMKAGEISPGKLLHDDGLGD